VGEDMKRRAGGRGVVMWGGLGGSWMENLEVGKDTDILRLLNERSKQNFA